jgi:hypothetical protein
MNEDIVERLTYEGCDELSCAILRGDAVREIERLKALSDELHQRGLLQAKLTSKYGGEIEFLETEVFRLQRLLHFPNKELNHD